MRRRWQDGRRRSGPRLGAALLCLAALAFDVTAVAAHAVLLDARRAAADAVEVAAAGHGHSAPAHDAADCPVCRDRVQPRAGLLRAPAAAPAAPLPAIEVRASAPFVSGSSGVPRPLGARAPPALS